MLPTKGYATHSPTSPLTPFSFERREPGDNDILIQIDYCGVCHSDIHSARSEWGRSRYPLVPGHEIAGHVTRAGKNVKKFKEGDLAGVGCFVDSCRHCRSCEEGLEQYCEGHLVMTYGSKDKDQKGVTYGGYSSQIVVDENYALKISPKLNLAAAAPLMCAGITTYSPLRHWKVTKGTRVAVVGLGGLGHMAVKLANAMEAEVTVLSTSRKKQEDAKRLGAHEFEVTTENGVFEKLDSRFDLIIDAVSARHDYNAYLNLLRRDGTMVLLGIPPEPTPVGAFSLVLGRRSLAGSLIGGIKETQEMLDFCAAHNVVSDVEVIAMKEINNAYERMIKGDVRYRFSIDMKTL